MQKVCDHKCSKSGQKCSEVAALSRQVAATEFWRKVWWAAVRSCTRIEQDPSCILWMINRRDHALPSRDQRTLCPGSQVPNLPKSQDAARLLHLQVSLGEASDTPQETTPRTASAPANQHTKPRPKSHQSQHNLQACNQVTHHNMVEQPSK